MNSPRTPLPSESLFSIGDFSVNDADQLRQLMHESLTSFAVEVGTQVASCLLEDDVVKLCGEKSERVLNRANSRHGSQRGYVILGGQKVAVWRQRLQQFDPSSITVAQFCQLEGVSQAAFYKWRKTLRELSQQSSPESTQPEVSFVPLRLSAVAESRVDVATDHAEHLPVAPPLASTTIELPGGVRIRVEVPTEFTSSRSGGDQS